MGIFDKLFGKKESVQPEVVSAIKLNENEIAAVVAGEVVELKTVKDPVFSSEMMGKGVGIIPSANEVYAPISGTITVAYPTGHAYGILADNGIEILIHIGIDTVNLEGKHFTTNKKQGDKIQAGELLGSFDREAIKKAGYDTTVMLIVTNTDQYQAVKPTKLGTINAKDVVLDVTK